MTRDVQAHVVPFLVWVAAIFLPDFLDKLAPMPFAMPAYLYGGKSLICGALLLYYKPWRLYRAGHTSWGVDLIVGCGVGLAVTILWVLPETSLMQRLFPAAYHQYHLWGIMMPGGLPSYYDPQFAPALPPGHASWAFAPAFCGWGWTLLKLFGSAVVIATIEEYFFRGFLYRWFQDVRFLQVRLDGLDWRAFLLTMLCFGFEHDRWIGGLIAGFAYGMLAVKTGSLRSAIIAHCITNLLLGIYVIVTRQYGFW